MTDEMHNHVPPTHRMSHVAEPAADRRRWDSQCRAILTMLERGPMTLAEMRRVSYRPDNRLWELRTLPGRTRPMRTYRVKLAWPDGGSETMDVRADSEADAILAAKQRLRDQNTKLGKRTKRAVRMIAVPISKD